MSLINKKRKHPYIVIAGILAVIILLLGNTLILYAQENEIDIPSPEKPALESPHELVYLLLKAINGLSQGQALNNGQENSLRQELDKSLNYLVRGEANEALNWLESFKNRTESYIQKGILPQNEGQSLTVMTDQTIESIQVSAFSRIKAPICKEMLCLDPPAVNYQVLYVREGVRTKGDYLTDGSAERPFPTIAQALAKAEELDYKTVEVIVGEGTYAGDLCITRPTKIIGLHKPSVIIVGSIINNSSSRLTVDSVTITSPKESGVEVAEEGAIIVNNACASTFLQKVDIISPLNYGVFHNGGRLSAEHVLIRNTRATDSSTLSGTAVFLLNVNATIELTDIKDSGRFGVRQIGGSLTLYRALIRNTKTKDEFSKAGTGIWTSRGAKTAIQASIIDRSESSALIIEGRDTETVLREVYISDTKVNPYLMQESIQAFAAIQIQEEAKFSMDWSTILNNEYISLRVTENSQAIITNTLFSHTRAFPDHPLGGGINIQAKNNSYIYLEAVTISYADLCGLQLYRGGTIDYHIGEVSHNTVGVNIQTEGFDASRLMDRVVYFENERNFDGSSLPVPDVPDF